MDVDLSTKRYASERQQRVLEHLQQYVDDVLEAFHSGSGAAPGKVSQPITLPIARELLKYEINRVLREGVDDAYAYFRLEGADANLAAWMERMIASSDLEQRWSFRFVGARGDECAVLFATVHVPSIPTSHVATGIVIARECNLHLRDWSISQ
jgi:hypothetical protein